MRRCHLTENPIITRLGEDGPKAQSTISRWKTLDVRPNRHKYLDLLRHIFHLNQEQIDAMLWLAGTPPLLRQEITEVFGSSQILHEKNEKDLSLAGYELLIDTIGTDLGLPSPQWETNEGCAYDEDEFTFTVKTPGEKFMVNDDDLPLRLEGRYWPPHARPLVRVVLQDIHSNHYLQSPPVNFMPDGCWIADNIIPGKGITTVNFVAVDAQGHNVFMRKVQRREWGAFSDLPEDGKIIKSLPLRLRTN